MNKYFLIILLIVSTFVSFSSALDNGFTNWDEPKYLTQNKKIQELSLESVSDLFRRTKIGYHHYIPLTLLTFSIEHHFFGFNPQVFILNNIVLHCINSLLVFWLVFLLAKRLDVAGLTAFLFALHPMHVESVAWIVERKDVLYALFYLASLVVYLLLKEYPEKKLKYYLISIVLFVCSLFAKPAAVTLPLVLVLLDLTICRSKNNETFLQDVGKSLLSKIPFFILSGVFVGIGLGQQKQGLFDIYSNFERILIGSNAFLNYIIKIFFPFSLSAFYPVPARVNGSLPFDFLFAPIVLMVVLSLMLYIFRKNKELMFGLFFYCVTIFLVTFVGASTALMSDRYTYIPSIGIFFILSMLVSKSVDSKFMKKHKVRVSVKFVIVSIVIVLSFLTFERCKVWENGITLWTDVISKYDKVAIAYVNRGNEYGVSKKYGLALKDFNKALKLEPLNLNALTSRGYLYYITGENQKAMDDFSRAISAYPKYVPAYLNRSLVYDKLGMNKEAIADRAVAKSIESMVFVSDQ